MIPHRFHFVWMGKRFPFVYRLAVESVLQTNPGASVTVHFQDPPEGNPDWDALRRKVEFRPVDVAAWLAKLPESARGIEAALQRIPADYPAGRSNVLRYLALVAEGGIYLDFDTLTLKSFTPLLRHPAFVGEEEVFKCDDDRVSGRYTWDFPLMAAFFGASYGVSYANARWLGDNAAVNTVNRVLMKAWSALKLNNAVLGSEPGSPFFTRALERVPRIDPGLRFGLGPMLMNEVFLSPGEAQAQRYGKEFFYMIPPSQTFRFFHGPAPRLPDEAVVVHWVSSNHRKLAPTLTQNALAASNSKSLYPVLARQVIARGI